MPEIQLSGLATGIDTAAIVEQLMQVERRRLNVLETSITGYDEKRTAISELSSKLGIFRSALKALSNASQLRSYQAKTSDSDLLTASANYNAAEGTHNIKIRQLATANRLVHNTGVAEEGFNYLSEHVGAGNFILSYNNQEFIIQTAADTTLEDLAELINNDPDNTGITASILKYDDPNGYRYHLVLGGRESGSDYQVSVNASNTDVHTSTQMFDTNGNEITLTTRISEIQGAENFTQINIFGTQHDTTGVDHDFDINQDTTVEELLEEIESAYADTVRVILEDGKIIVTDKTSGASPLSITLTFQGGAAGEGWTPPTFTETTEGGTVLNELAKLNPSYFIEAQAAQDAMIKYDGYPLGDDTDENTWIRRSSNTIDDVISGVTLNLHGVTGNDDDGYTNVEVSLTRDTEDLKEKMNAMVEAYNAVIMYIDEQTEYDEEEKKSGILSAEYSLSSISSLIRSPFNLNAEGFNSNDTFLRPSDIGLEVGADGMLELDETAFDEAIVDNYLDLLALIGAQKTGTSDSTVVEFYQASRHTDAGEYDVRVTVDATGTITSAQIKTNDEDWSDARDMTIDGNTLYGSEETGSDGYPLHPEYSLALSVDTSQIGTFDVTVNIRQGFAGNLYEMVDDMLKTGTGRVSIAQDSIQDRIDSLERRIEDEEDRLERTQERLQMQFARMERNLQIIQQQMSGLSLL